MPHSARLAWRKIDAIKNPDDYSLGQLRIERRHCLLKVPELDGATVPAFF
jgi:hypothetical protein